ncbi:hypothetical protein MMC30_007136 [Trapelia coarctata]|nr:hypothetical protein [Trapelia coarctata]
MTGMRTLQITRTLCIRSSSRGLHTSTSLFSGHSRWSKIKHDKGKVDASKTKQRSSLAKELTSLSKSHGPDPNNNTRLAAAITAAKKAGFPKQSIEAAIARGQGRSTSGAALENVTIEAMLPNAIAAVIECQTDSKLRLLQVLRDMFKSYGANITPTTYLFDKKGKLIFQPSAKASGDELLEHAIEAGALDVETDDDGNIVVLTEPSEVTSVGQALTNSLGLKIESTELIWDPKKDSAVDVDSPQTLEAISKLTIRLEEEPSVLGIFFNVA